MCLKEIDVLFCIFNSPSISKAFTKNPESDRENPGTSSVKTNKTGQKRKTALDEIIEVRNVAFCLVLTR